jgi:hypothetical protein
MYEIYLDDKPNNQYTKLDTDTIDMTSVFAISDINDVSKRKDTYSKNLTFQDTQRNNEAFGFSGVINKYINSDETSSNLLFWAYNPQVLVPVYIYENGVLIIKGTLRHLKTNRNPNGTKSYQCVITGEIKDFTGMLADKTLSDLDMSNLSHVYNLSSIRSNWNQDPKTQGYVYPLIHNGVPFANNASVNVNNPNPFQILNFKPAVFVTAILDKIFEDSNVNIDDDRNVTRVGLPYNWRLEGSDEFKTMFSNLIIPNNQIKLTNAIEYDGVKTIFKLDKTAVENGNRAFFPPTNSTQFNAWNLVCDNVINVRTDTLKLMTPAAAFGGTNTASVQKANTVYNVLRTFKTTATIDYNVSTNNTNGYDMIGTIFLFERDAVAESNADGFNTFDGWDIVASESFNIPANSTNHINQIKITEREYRTGKQLRMSFVSKYPDGSRPGNSWADKYQFAVNEFDLSFPDVQGSKIVIDIALNESVIPTLPTGVKQLDFLNSLRNLFNLYVYTDNDTRTVVFEPYDDYYERTQGLQIFNHALDWSSKIDSTSASTIETNVEIQKSYQFTWKSDSDYINDYYNKKYNRNYGDLTVTDSKGISDTPKKVELIFSSTPTVLAAPNVKGQGGFSLPIPWIYKMDGDNVAPLDTNIRILHYNGVQPFKDNGGKDVVVTVISEVYNASSVSYSPTAVAISEGAMASNFIMDNTYVPTRDLHFSNPNEAYWKKFPNLPTSYSFYDKQFKELRNPNVLYFEGEAYLNESDISLLDLSVPVFIDLGIDGHAYWKVLEVQYTNNARSSTIKLQKIIV